MRLWSVLAITLVAAGLAVEPSVASGLGTVQGQIRDASQSVVAGADVFARDLKSGLEIRTTSSGRGEFRFELKPGRYEIIATANDFAAARRTIEVRPQQQESVDLRLEPAPLSQQVVVTASREEELAESSIVKVDVVSRAFIQDTGYERVSDVLSEEPGVVTRSGASGNRSETQIQGVDSRQTLILFDGFPVVGARGVKRGILNMDRQSTGRLERVEVVKGAASALHGSDAMGGVINMIPRRPRQRFEANLTGSAGSYGAADFRGDAGFVRGGWYAFLDAERHKRNPFDLTPDSFDTTASGFHRYDYLAKAGYDFSERLKLGLLANVFDNQELGNLNGELGPTVTRTNDSAQNYGITLDAGLSRLTNATFRGYYGKYDESSVSNLLADGGGADTNANLNERLYRLDGTLSHVWGSHQLVQGGVEWTQDEYRGFNRMVGDNAGQQITMVDTWINDRIEAHPRLSLTVGGRWNHHSLYGDNFVPRLGALARVTDRFRLRLSWGKGFRAPDLGQLYFRFLNPTNLYQVIGNPSLEPERSSSFQAGFDYRRGRVRLQTTFFRNDIENLIQADLIGRPSTPEELQALLGAFGVEGQFIPGLNRLFFFYRNLEDVYTQGVESKLEVQITRSLLVSSTYMYLDARDKETDAFLPQRHRHHGNFRVFWSTDRLGGLRTNFRGTYFSRWPVGAATIGDAYQIWDWYVAKPLRGGFETYASVDNVFDSTDPNLGSAEPSFLRADPGRMFRVGMRWTFGIE